MKTKNEVGLMSMLNLPNARKKYTNASELQRYSRLEEVRFRRTLANSAVLIQKNFRMFSAKNKLQLLKNQKEFRIKEQKATKIQSYIRGFLGRKRAKFLALSKRIFDIRDHAAGRIQNQFRIATMKKRLKILAIMGKVNKSRNSAALSIQKRVKGFLVRKDLFFIRSKKIAMLISWKYTAKSVYITGNFTLPPWKVEIPLMYSKYLGIFFSGFFIENKLTPGQYLLKFIVDGCWLCDGHYPIQQDKEGNYNNIISVVPKLKKLKHSESSIELKLRSSIKQKKEAEFIKPIFDLNRKMSNSLFLNSDSNIITEILYGSYTCQKPTSQKLVKSSESSHFLFINEETQTFGLAQSNPVWDFFEIDPYLFPFSLLKEIQSEFSNSFSILRSSEVSLDKFFRNLLLTAKSYIKCPGSSAILFGCFLNNFIHFLNLGDSRLILLRKAGKGSSLIQVFASARQRSSKSTNELTHIPSSLYYTNYFFHRNPSLITQHFSESTPEDAEFYSVNIQPDDVIIIASAGILNNLYSEDILKISEKFLAMGLTNNHYCERVANALAMESIKKGSDPNYRSPHCKEQKKPGKIGGVLQDCGVIVSIAIEKRLT